MAAPIGNFQILVENIFKENVTDFENDLVKTLLKEEDVFKCLAKHNIW